jgi:glycosyltransferase involved in cell wall biosynthesis
MIAAVVPALNAERTIDAVTRGVRAAQVDAVFVIDDGSTDATAGLAESAGATVLRHPANRGKGAALWTGFAAALGAGAAAVLTLDADGQHDPAELPRLRAAHEAQPEALVVGARALAPNLMPARSRLGNRVSTHFLSCFTGRALSDSQSGFRVYPSQLLREVSPRARRFDAETELLLAAVSQGRPVVEVPVRTIYQRDSSSHFRDVADTARIIKVVLRWLTAERLRS